MHVGPALVDLGIVVLGAMYGRRRSRKRETNQELRFFSIVFAGPVFVYYADSFPKQRVRSRNYPNVLRLPSGNALFSDFLKRRLTIKAGQNGFESTALSDDVFG